MSLLRVSARTFQWVYGSTSTWLDHGCIHDAKQRYVLKFLFTTSLCSFSHGVSGFDCVVMEMIRARG